MTADYAVTVWHFAEDESVPQRKVFKNVYLDAKNQISKNGIKQKGFYRGDTCRIRIFTEEEIGVLPGDYLCIGEIFGEFPDREKSMKITEVKDNRRGGRMHWRISCGG